MENEILMKIANLVSNQILLSTKEILTSAETARYMGISINTLYKLTSSRQIPHYKPTGKMCFFKRVEIEEWLLQGHHRVATRFELNVRAQEYCMKGGVR